MLVNSPDGNGMPFLQALSQFYLLLLFPTKVQCINRVNGQVRQELPLTPSFTLSVGPQTAQTLALASDDAEGTVYLMAGDLHISDLIRQLLMFCLLWFCHVINAGSGMNVLGKAAALSLYWNAPWAVMHPSLIASCLRCAEKTEALL